MISRKTMVAAVALCAGGVACTPHEVGLWQQWHDEDPAAAQAFADNYAQQGSGGGGGGGGGDGAGQPGNCDSYRDEMAAVGLPVDTFVNIAWRESRCNPLSTVIDWNDTGGGLFGFNFKGNLAEYWDDLCGLTWENLTSSVDRQMRCAKAAYDQLGLQPWEGSA